MTDGPTHETWCDGIDGSGQCGMSGCSFDTDKLNDIARAICDSEAFMWLMVGANHPEAHLNLLRGIWQEHYLPAGGGYGKKVRGE